MRLERTRSYYLLILIVMCAVLASAQQTVARAEQIPQDTGAAGLQQELLRLGTTARLLHITAHPDDEDGGMLTLESRGKGASVVLLTLNRGEGGQNKTGPDLFDKLGVLRTLELMAADRYYGAQQRFSRVADFGYSKSAAETFEKWGGHDVALADVVRVIRTFRPDVIVSRFQGTARDGHGHHEAAGILSREAFSAAADPKRFPEQISEGLAPWQAKKFYIDNVRENEDWTVRYDTGENSPVLGMSYRQFAMQGLKYQLSQGADAWNAQPGQYFTYYKLVESKLANTSSSDGHERDFFDGIDTSVTGLGALAPGVPDMASLLNRIDEAVRSAKAASEPTQIAHALLAGRKATEAAIASAQNAKIAPEQRATLLAKLTTKREQFDDAARLALGLTLSATLDPAHGTEIVVPGETFQASVALSSEGKAALHASDIQLDVPEGWKVQRTSKDGAASNSATFRVTVPSDATFTRAYFHREDPERDAIYTIDEPAYATLPFMPPPVRARATYEVDGESGSITSPLQAEVTEDGGKRDRRTVAVAPAFSVRVQPSTLVIPEGTQKAEDVSIEVRCNVDNVKEATLSARAVPTWRIEPASANVSCDKRGEEKRFKFYVFPDEETHEGVYRLRAQLEHEGRIYDQGYTTIGRPDIGTAYYYEPAVERVSVVRVALPKYLHVGYVMGAGDEIPSVLHEIGMDVKVISPQELKDGDLRQYGTIVLGVRAYDTRADVRENNRRLLEYVQSGGTLIVQYNSNVAGFNAGNYMPYRGQLGRDRVSDENAPVEITDPNEDVFDFPNEIAKTDFNGWVQERGLYFMNTWEWRFRPLLSMHDPGEQPLRGSLLVAPYGHGLYVYTGLSFFRQLPAGVPGAVRLFVNLVSLGHDLGR